MLLNSGTVYSTHLHRAYSQRSVQTARAVVDSLMNGEDILFNFVATNVTGLPPFIIKSSKAVKSVEKSREQSPLSGRSEHFSDRSRLLNTFAKYFNGDRSMSSSKLETVPPFVAWWENAIDNGEQIATHRTGLVLPKYTSVVSEDLLQNIAEGHTEISKVFADADMADGAILYQFSPEGSTLQLPNGALYSTVVADHANLKLNLKSTPQTAPVADSATFAHWVQVDHSSAA